MFSENNIGEEINCANGELYEIDGNSDFNLIGDSEGLIINSAVNYGGTCPGPFPSIDIETDCDILTILWKASLKAIL